MNSVKSNSNQSKPTQLPVSRHIVDSRQPMRIQLTVSGQSVNILLTVFEQQSNKSGLKVNTINDLTIEFRTLSSNSRQTVSRQTGHLHSCHFDCRSWRQVVRVKQSTETFNSQSEVKSSYITQRKDNVYCTQSMSRFWNTSSLVGGRTMGHHQLRRTARWDLLLGMFVVAIVLQFVEDRWRLCQDLQCQRRHATDCGGSQATGRYLHRLAKDLKSWKCGCISAHTGIGGFHIASLHWQGVLARFRRGRTGIETSEDNHSQWEQGGGNGVGEPCSSRVAFVSSERPGPSWEHDATTVQRKPSCWEVCSSPNKWDWLQR